jgi:elongation factor P hydroxylase
MQHDFKDLILIFEQCFFQRFNTKLIKGDDEPLYSPADDKCVHHQIIFAHGYYASALHEVSHWCMAGSARRLLEDFGYWYMPDGRNNEQQKNFEQVEIKPQAIEWAFCVAAGKKFNVSADNLNGATPDTLAFKENVYQQVQQYLNDGFPPRARQFIDALANFYNVSLPLNINQFSMNGKLNHPEICTHV